MEHYGINSAGVKGQPENDVFCIAIGNSTDSKRFNAHSSSCKARLAVRDIPKACRTCKGIVEVKPVVKKKIVRLVNPEYAVKKCECGNNRKKRHSFCDDCKTAKRKAINKANKDKQIKAAKYCKRCERKLTNRKLKYCSDCRPIIKAEKRAVTNDRRREKYAMENVSGLMDN